MKKTSLEYSLEYEKLFIYMVEVLEKKLHFKKDTFTIKKDNRIRGLCIELYNYIDGNNEDCYMITYNSKKLLNKVEMLMGILHELGHCRKKHLTINHGLSLEEMEYQAEEFALDAIKKYYSKYYKKALNLLNRYIDGPDNLYSRAFGKLYRERIEELNAKK